MNTSTGLEIRRVNLLSPVAQQLILALNAELEGRYPEEGANFFNLDAEEVAEGRGGFFVAYIADEPVGCGAVRSMTPGVAEIKRMYVAPVARGRPGFAWGRRSPWRSWSGGSCRARGAWWACFPSRSRESRTLGA